MIANRHDSIFTSLMLRHSMLCYEAANFCKCNKNHSFIAEWWRLQTIYIWIAGNENDGKRFRLITSRISVWMFIRPNESFEMTVSGLHRGGLSKNPPWAGVLDKRELQSLFSWSSWPFASHFHSHQFNIWSHIDADMRIYIDIIEIELNSAFCVSVLRLRLLYNVYRT